MHRHTYYIVYRTTNKINGKIYVGKHRTNNLDDGYLGSGRLLRRAIKKHGVDAFERTVLAIFDTEDGMNKMEAELVTEEFCLREDTYNICRGGHGGFSHINRVGRRAFFTDAAWRKMQTMDRTRCITDATRAGLKRAHAEGRIKYDTFTGRQHTEESKLKISKAASARTGNRNSQHGSCWITDGSTNRKLRRDEPVPTGWKKGRV